MQLRQAGGCRTAARTTCSTRVSKHLPGRARRWSAPRAAGSRPATSSMHPAPVARATTPPRRRCRCAAGAAPARSPAAPRAKSIADATGALGSLAIAWRSSRSSESGTSARPVDGGGLSRTRRISSKAELSPPRHLERRTPDQQVPQRRGERVDVAAHARRLGRVQHLGRRPRHRDAGVLVVALGDRAGDAEVGQPRRPRTG